MNVSLATPGTAQERKATTLLEAIRAMGSDLETLVALNAAVTPLKQLELLDGIHKELSNFLAP